MQHTKIKKVPEKKKKPKKCKQKCRTKINFQQQKQLFKSNGIYASIPSADSTYQAYRKSQIEYARNVFWKYLKNRTKHKNCEQIHT